MSTHEKQLLEAINAKSGYQVFAGSTEGVVRIARTTKNSVNQQSVWLGRKSTVENLQRILASAV